MTRTESARVSPFFASDVLPPLSKPITLPPIRWIAVSNERRVRVEGSKKQLATTLCLISSEPICLLRWTLL
ncbi:Uncharacterised protein [Vibrio cholerae]|nr:Uncharacterised protein [Vibrio cholerae]